MMAPVERRFFEAAPASSGQARQFVGALLHDVISDDRLWDVKVATAEYASNAIEHAGSGFTVVVDVSPAAVTVHVVDVGSGGTSAPRTCLEEVDHASERGRGRFLVDALADETGVHPAAECCSPGTPGWCCWFRFTLASGLGVAS